LSWRLGNERDPIRRWDRPNDEPPRAVQRPFADTERRAPPHNGDDACEVLRRASECHTADEAAARLVANPLRRIIA
jgi:hypothetical protein